MKKSSSVVLLLVTLLGACASVPFNVPADYKLSQSSGNGVLVLSVSENCPSTMSINVRMENGGNDHAIAIDQSKALRSAPLQWTNPCGRVIIRELPAGKHFFYSFFAFGLIPGATFASPVENLAIPINIRPGKATYVGHYQFKFKPGEPSFSFSVEDRAERDLPLARANSSDLSAENFVREIPALTNVNKPLRLKGTNVQIQVVR